MATGPHREVSAVERETCNSISHSLLNENDNIKNLLSGFDIEEELSIAFSEENVSITEEKDTSVFGVESYSSNENQLEILREVMETIFWHFNTFKDFVNAKTRCKQR